MVSRVTSTTALRKTSKSCKSYFFQKENHYISVFNKEPCIVVQVMGHLNETLIQGLSGGVGSHTVKPITANYHSITGP